MRILVLCKDIADHSIIKQVLEHNGHEVVVVDNTEIAWDFLDGGQTRLLMLQTIREFALERLEEDPEFSVSVRRAHAGYFAG